MELSNLDTLETSEAGSWMILYHPKTQQPIRDDSTGKESRIRLAGMDSEKYRKEQRKAQNRRLSMRGGRRQTLTAEELESEALDLLCTCTLEFENIELEGVALSYDIPTARKLYTRFPWIREQVDQFIADRSNFLK